MIEIRNVPSAPGQGKPFVVIENHADPSITPTVHVVRPGSSCPGIELDAGASITIRDATADDLPKPAQTATEETPP